MRSRSPAPGWAPTVVSGRNTPTEPTSRSRASSRPSATADLPVRPSDDATYTLRLTSQHYVLAPLGRGSCTGPANSGSASFSPWPTNVHPLGTYCVRVVTTPRLGGLTDWRPLARGGFAVVWEAHQQSLDRQVAVKIITRKLDNPEERERFLRESSAAGRMSSHPGIVTVHDAGLLDDDRPYLVMELCTGGSLTRRLTPENRQSQEWVRDLGVRIADALDAAHGQGVLHRDVKPANVLIDQYGHAGLADFGLAVMTDGMDLEERLEALTPAYAPPEAFAPHTPTASGDVYSLAATLYALLCGHAPRAVDPDQADPDMTAAQVVMAHLDDPVERLPDVDPRLMDVLMEALDDDPARRPTAAAFRDALQALPLASPPPRCWPSSTSRSRCAPSRRPPVPGPADAGRRGTGAAPLAAPGRGRGRPPAGRGPRRRDLRPR